MKNISSNEIISYYIETSGRCSGLVVSALDSKSRGLGLNPGRAIALCSWAEHFTVTVPLHPGV